MAKEFSQIFLLETGSVICSRNSLPTIDKEATVVLLFELTAEDLFTLLI
jgi:hypothetical protein